VGAIIPEPQSATPPRLPHVWEAQVGLWAQQWLVDAIVETNKDSTKVKDSVVKRLVSVAAPRSYIVNKGSDRLISSARDASAAARGGAAAAPSGGAGDTEGAAAPPVPRSSVITSTEIESTTRDLSRGASGRVSNSDYDVMPMSFTVDVDAERFGEFLANLEHNRCITVLNVNQWAIDRELWRRAGYVYGDRPVLQIKVDCEVLFFRKWTVEGGPPSTAPVGGVMPDSVRELLGIKKMSGAKSGS
jgi:hypothetical protein